MIQKGEKEPLDKVGRPNIEIDYKQAEGLGSIQCSLSECAAVLDIDENTLKNDSKFMTLWRKGKEKGKKSLRRTQFELAQQNATMAIWLGKQYLGQTEKQEISANQAVTIISDVKKE